MTLPFLSTLWRKQPETVSTDLIVPVRFWDDLHHMRSHTIDFTYRFDDVLDLYKLESSLSDLLQIGNWRQLGARLRRNRSGQLEYHIPAQYSVVRPAFHFTSFEYDMNIQEHALGSRLPQAGIFNDQETSLHPSTAEFDPLVRHPSAPRSIDDYIYSDIPQLHIHIVLFHNATLLTITHSHVLFDALSRATFLRAWTSVLDGRFHDVPHFVSLEQDPLHAIGEDQSPAQSYTQYQHLITGLGLVIFGTRQLWDLLWHWREEEYTIRLSGRCVERMHQTALQELEVTKDTKVSNKTNFVSKSDIILAWWVQTMAKVLDLPASRTIMVMNVFSIVGILPANTVSPPDAFLAGNAIFFAYTLLSARDLLESQRPTHVALEVRQSLTTHRTLDQVQAMAAIQRSSFLQTPFLIGPPDIQNLACTNSSAAKDFDVDFSGAICSSSSFPSYSKISSTSTKHVTARGRPSHLNLNPICDRYPTRNVLRVIGKDAAGDWWLVLKARSGLWPAIQNELAALAGM